MCHARKIELEEEMIEMFQEDNKIHKVEKGERVDYHFKNEPLVYKGNTKLNLPKPIHLINSMGEINSDHRGSDHLNIDLTDTFEVEHEIPSGTLTVTQFVEHCWRIRSHHFENHHEKCFEFDVDEEIDEIDEIVIDDGEYWTVTPRMDHGS